MSPPPEDVARHSTSPPDRQTLQLLERGLASDSLIEETTFNPDPSEPGVFYTVFDSGQSLHSISLARVNIRWVTPSDERVV